MLSLHMDTTVDIDRVNRRFRFPPKCQSGRNIIKLVAPTDAFAVSEEPIPAEIDTFLNSHP